MRRLENHMSYQKSIIFRSRGFVPDGVGAKIVVIIVLKFRTHFVSLVIQRDNVTTVNGRRTRE
jgi:hypothetical protein